jgi:hypothetical protein
MASQQQAVLLHEPVHTFMVDRRLPERGHLTAQQRTDPMIVVGGPLIHDRPKQGQQPGIVSAG